MTAFGSELNPFLNGPSLFALRIISSLTSENTCYDSITTSWKQDLHQSMFCSMHAFINLIKHKSLIVMKKMCNKNVQGHNPWNKITNGTKLSENRAKETIQTRELVNMLLRSMLGLELPWHRSHRLDAHSGIFCLNRTSSNQAIRLWPSINFVFYNRKYWSHHLMQLK